MIWILVAALCWLYVAGMYLADDHLWCDDSRWERFAVVGLWPVIVVTSLAGDLVERFRR